MDVPAAALRAGIRLLAGGVLLAGLGGPAGANEQPFDAWLDGVRQEARGRGVSDRILDASLTGIKPIPRIIELDRSQPEFKLKVDEYLSRVVTQGRIDYGRTLLQRHHELLDAVSKQYGVQKRFIVALWGIETDFGRITGGFDVVTALATLAYDGRRSEFFRKELMFALEILEQGHIAPKDMQGSWAGAMGQSQFMPSSFHLFAVDQDRDGDKDIWGSLPDVFGSIATYLSKSGWRDDITWGREVSIPAGFDKTAIAQETKKTLPQWEALGVRKVGGGELPGRAVEGRMVEVTQRDGSSRYFMAYENFETILKWNRSTYFAIAVGTLADALGAR
ncbi:lytic murein transglycosylase [Thalassobaculum sp. OXR-137]|uniref:lytic murein transglycosylase n=1 Tax=Thalassobaculum sp. OXR-137 TaxID=3100173 RepID=UPI002AC99BEF|nr:lytic murein transglycosylase [Thalassobaculum sp. OXR-137]WPZ33144.1 lytic murein transglycosylase [Thalassobaculum sp. OXR-137]